MKIIGILCAVLYGAAGIYDSIQADRGGNRFLKPFLMPLLCAVYLCLGSERSLSVIAALLFAWLGDIFLLKKSDQGFLLSLSSFLLCHVCYIPVFLRSVNGIGPMGMIGLAVYLAYAVLVIRNLKYKAGKKLFPATVVYVCVIASMSFSAYLSMVSAMSGISVLIWAGTVVFTVSDTLLAYQRFSGLKQHGVMITYICAQAMIVTGLIL